MLDSSFDGVKTIDLVLDMGINQGGCCLELSFTLGMKRGNASIMASLMKLQTHSILVDK